MYKNKKVGIMKCTAVTLIEKKNQNLDAKKININLFAVSLSACC
jgi:hypothetical protein